MGGCISLIKCRKCKLMKDVDCFKKNPLNVSGFTTKCTDCLKTEATSFEENSIRIHGEKYRYNMLDDYIGDRVAVTIFCNRHNTIFQQRPFAHIKGQGCPLCGQESRANTATKTTERFIKDAVKVHGDLYDYSKVTYTGAFNKIVVICQKQGHGQFTLSANNHLQGQGCKLCAREDNCLGSEKFIKESKDYYGDGAFDYSQVNYTNNTTKVLLKCNTHSEWFGVTPMFHRDPCKGSGCKFCGKLSSNRWSITSVLKIPNIDKIKGYIYIGTISCLPDSHYKIGITENLTGRLAVYRNDLKDNGEFKYIYNRKTDYLTCVRIEAVLKKFLKKFHTKPLVDFGGKNEVFSLQYPHLVFTRDVVMGVYDKELLPHLDNIKTNKFGMEFFYDLYDEVKDKYEHSNF